MAPNEVSGNGFGIFFRHSQHAAFLYNDAHDNCIGMFILSAPPRPPVGDSVVRFNNVRHNNKACKGSEEEVPFDYGGGGIVMVGAKGMVVGNNTVLSNRGSSPFSGGIVLLSAAPFGGGPSTGNKIQNNTSFRNTPADIIDHSEGRNTFVGNSCNASMPRGLCKK